MNVNSRCPGLVTKVNKIIISELGVYKMDAVVAVKSMDVSTPEILWHGGKLFLVSVVNERAVHCNYSSSIHF